MSDLLTIYGTNEDLTPYKIYGKDCPPRSIYPGIPGPRPPSSDEGIKVPPLLNTSSSIELEDEEYSPPKTSCPLANILPRKYREEFWGDLQEWRLTFRHRVKLKIKEMLSIYDNDKLQKFISFTVNIVTLFGVCWHIFMLMISVLRTDVLGILHRLLS